MSKTALPRLLPLAATLLAIQAASASPSIINGGGAASQQFNYAAPDVNGMHVGEMPEFGSLQTGAAFGTYWSTTSGVAQTGLLNNDLTCLINKVNGNNGGQCSGTVGGVDTVHYAVAESVLTSTQISNWASSATGQVQAGNLIQIPMLGTGLAVVVNNPLLSGNGQAGLSDNDLCGIFSGKITDFSNIKDSPVNLGAGTIQVLYRSDSAGTTFLLTNHLSAVCNAQNSNITFIATSSLSSLFTGGVVPANFVGVSGLAVLANTLAGLTGPGYPLAISYISPDWTSLDSATSSAKLSNGQPSPLLVAGLQNGKKFLTPTVANIKIGLSHPRIGQNLQPPQNATAAANPSNWVPTIQTTSAGYPMVGYSTFDFPQCYADPAIAKGMEVFLKDHFHNSAFLQIQTNNGLVAVANSGAAKFVATIGADFITNGSGFNLNINNPVACNGLVGR